MRIVREILGYAVGGILFVILLPLLMWLVSGRPSSCPSALLLIVALLLAVVGLSVSIWAIVYMRRKGDGNPMDAFGHEVAPRTSHLMTQGPYRYSRNPMLTGIFIYYAGVCLWLVSWQSLAVFAVFVAVMLVQVRSEEKRLRRDFGNEYDEYCRRTRRF